jgi:hypothetical protein
MNRNFKGIWIPKNIWLIENLKPTYRIFLAEIDSLDNGQGCTAKNEHFSKLFGLSKNRCSEIIKMLSEFHYITISYVRNQANEVRFLNVKDPFGKSNPHSVSRQTPSISRQTPSISRLPNIKDLVIQKSSTKEKEARAFDYLELKCSLRLEQEFLMKYKSKIKDFEKFVLDFNDKVTIEKLTYDSDTLLARISSYARNWIQNQEKFNINPVSNNKPLTSMD